MSTEVEKVHMSKMKRHIFVDEPYGCEAIEFYKAVFRAVEVNRVYEEIETDDEIKGSVRVVSCELQLCSSIIIVSELTPKSCMLNQRNVAHLPPRGTMLVYAEDVAPVVDLAARLGSSILKDEKYEKHIKDPYGSVWIIRTVPAAR
ncbi:hypothetical protein DCAR_0726838 [Daucus carota subsp. sativus]|uniref:Glyoxalase At5g48480-like N-terminal domain-containing protein n=1 Tax=Daucus carota subsp. sativus TaxID=79200 RepID=A0A161Y299_DAUCS|nr:hypothetical protein DCAR_0726838 [Daucus carota subsp. sativus]